MNRRIEYTARFRKDLKRYKNQKERIRRIWEVVRILEQGIPIPKSYRPHKLIGNYSGCLELHIEGDLLLIWTDLDESGLEVLRLIRLGSHSDLFG